MFFKSKMQPAMAGAGVENTGRIKNSSFAFSAGSAEADDCKNFGDSFNAGNHRSNPTPNKNTNGGNGKKPPRKPKNNKFKLPFELPFELPFDIRNPKIWIIAGAAALALILIVTVIIVVSVANSGGDIKYQNNAYMAYKDQSGTSHVIANGTLIDTAFEGDIDLVISKDNSFAYVFDETDEGYVMYLLEGKKITPLLAGEPIDEIITTSTLKPGVVYMKTSGSGSHYMIYTKKSGERQIVRETKDPENFCISADGETVAYTIEGRNQDERILCIYEDGYSESTSSKNSIPVAVSGHGDYIYYSQTNNNGIKKLYVYDYAKGDSFEVEGSEYFRSIIEMNILGDEIIFTIERPDAENIIPDEEETTEENTENTENNANTETKNEGQYQSGISSHLYRYKQKKAENRILTLGSGEIRPAAGADPTVAVFENFADTYVCSNTATYYISSSYKKTTIQGKYGGKFSPDGKYFYFVNKDSDLVRMDLDSSRKTKVIGSEVVDFKITEKGNLYYLSIAEGDEEGNLYFYNVSANKPESLDYEATMLSFYDYADKAFYANTDGFIRASKDSSDNDVAKFGSKEDLTSVPYFTNPTCKVCYAIVYDPVAETYKIYYTSNGNNFSYIKSVTDCESVLEGGEELDLSAYMVDIIE